MTKQKDLKRVIRTRMEKTGESYTAARLHIVKPNYATLAGMSDAAIKKATGCDWARWVKTLDHRHAATMEHGDIARIVKSYGAPDWWTQTVTVGYERIKGLRLRGQRRNGLWEATRSRTFPVPVAKLFKAWADAKMRKKWLLEKLTIRMATSPKSMRIKWEDGTTIALGFGDKGAKSAVSVQHSGLKSKEDAERMKKYWSERLDALAEVL